VRWNANHSHFFNVSKLAEIYKPGPGPLRYFFIYPERILLIHYGNVAYQDQFIFALYCMTGPDHSSPFIKSGEYLKTFNFRQSKRLIGWIDTGQLIAAILATLIVIPFTTELIRTFCSARLVWPLCILCHHCFQFYPIENDPREFGSRAARDQTD
jgi:hypothetical protein